MAEDWWTPEAVAAYVAAAGAVAAAGGAAFAAWQASKATQTAQATLAAEDRRRASARFQPEWKQTDSDTAPVVVITNIGQADAREVRMILSAGWQLYNADGATEQGRTYWPPGARETLTLAAEDDSPLSLRIEWADDAGSPPVTFPLGPVGG